MGFWIFMSLMVLLMPVMLIVIGVIYMKKAPSEINNLSGYRTRRSMKNKETWDFAHRVYGKASLIIGAVSAPLFFIPMLFFINKDNNAVSVAALVIISIEMIPLFLSFIPVEISLKKNFDENGNKIEVPKNENK